MIISLNVSAEEKGFFIGGSIGYSSIDTLSESDVNATLAAGGITATSSVDDSDLGWKIFGGYNLNQYFGVEVGYVDLGETELDITATAPAAITASGGDEIDGFMFAGVARYPISEKFDVFGKVGGFVWDVEGAGTVTSGATTVAVSADEDGTDIMFGVGAEYEVMNNIGIRAEWERYKEILMTLPR
ncbi:MAG: outer membrane beta-barrel protein [Proteobacteria bacterium]|nr:outer membrane beta-barrel protein [Pseudomonadota bacterium]